MSCDEIRTILEEYIDGSASPEARAGVAGHLESCERCASEEQAIRSLKSRASALAHSIEPGRDLWSGIEAGLRPNPRRASASRIIEGEPRPGWPAHRAAHPRQFLAAAALAAVLAGAVYIWQTMPSPEGPSLVESGGAPAVLPAADFGSSSAVSPGLGGAELAFVEAKQQLRTALYERRKALSPETLKTVDHELKTIEDAIVVIRSAVETDPGNRELRKMLVATRQREVALLRHMTQTADLRSR